MHVMHILITSYVLIFVAFPFLSFPFVICRYKMNGILSKLKDFVVQPVRIIISKSKHDHTHQTNSRYLHVEVKKRTHPLP